MTLRANIFVYRVAPHAVAVIDCSSPRNPCMSVTNDAENVVAFLHEWGRLLPGDRLIYRDTDGIWDGLLHRDGKFAGFVPLRAAESAQALKRWDLLLDTPIDETPGAVL